MLVRQLVGPYAGQIVDMPYDVAKSCLAVGTAVKPEEQPKVKGVAMHPAVRGDDAHAATEVAPVAAEPEADDTDVSEQAEAKRKPGRPRKNRS